MIRITVAVVVLLITGCSDPGARTAEEAANVATVEAHVEAFNAQEEGWFDRFHAENLTYQGYGPGARTADRDGLKEMAYRAARFFPDRRMTVKRLVAEGDTVAMETEWTGTATEGHPILKSGERQVVRNILFNRYRDGKIVETREFSVFLSGSYD